MIDYPLFRAIGSLTPVFGSDVKSVILSSRSGVLREAARALAKQANHEFGLLNPSLDYKFAVVVDAPINGEENLSPSDSDQIRGIISCARDANGEWRGSDENLVLRRDGKYLGVFLGPIGNDGVRNCYLPFLIEDFPSENEPTPSFKQIAGAALRIVAKIDADKPIDPAKLGNTPGSKVLVDVFEVLRDAYRSFGNSDVPWNVLWMLHVDAGLANLRVAIEAGRISDRDVVDGTFGNLVYPCFSLPNPDSECFQKGRNLMKAVSSHWGSEDQVLVSLENIMESRKFSATPGTTPRSLILEQIEWRELDLTISKRTRGGRGNPLLGLFWHERGTPLKEKGFLDITEEEFFNPVSPFSRTMTILNPDHSPLRTASILEPTNILEPTTFVSGKSRTLESAEVLVVLPTIDPPHDQSVVTSSGITISDAVPKNRAAMGFDVLERLLLSDGRVAIRGRFFRKVSNAGTFEHLPSVRSIRVVIPEGDALLGRVQRDSMASVVMLGPDGCGVIVVGRPPRKKMTVVTWPDFDSSGKNIVDELQLEREIGRGRFRLIVWSREMPRDLTVGGARVEPLSDSWVRHVEPDLDVEAPVTIGFGDLSILLDVPDTDEDAGVGKFNSPLRACTEHGEVDLAPLEEDLRDVRSSLELKLFDISMSIANGSRHNGHVIVSAHLGEDIDSLEFDGDFMVHISPSIRGAAGMWPFSAVQKIPADVSESSQLERFLETFRALRLGEAVQRVSENGGARWLSKVDLDEHFRALGVDSPKLIDDYLDAYKDLVDLVDQTGSPSSRFWARFPFSVSIWSGTAAQLKGVLVSPYHPLRLAWLWAAESALRASQLHNETRKMMAGVVSGWQFPMLTRSNTPNGAMMAVPIDAGIDSVFAGWSMLVPASVDQALHLEIPERAADGRVPGVSSSGLDSTAVEGAVDDFCNANPFISTLVIDLAAASSAPRPSQIDRGLVLRILEWTRRRSAINQSAGGVRIFDSIKRLGEVSDEVKQLVDPSRASSLSVTWQRYDKDLPGRQANIRIMNDSGVRVSVGSTEQRNGLVANVPLRRFEIAVTNKQEASAELSPALDSASSTAFNRALNAAESFGLGSNSSARSISLTVSPDNAMLSGADWTVIGESGLPPSALASILQIEGAGRGTSTLWEWRPPFFEGSDHLSVGTVDRRPYMTLARIPKVFSGKLRGLVALLLQEEATEEQVTKKVGEVIRVLGARGVGLSSLISGKQQHRVHQKGALGFSLAFEMLDRASKMDVQRFVIPIDAAFQYLNVLSGFSRKEGGQRADLLLIEIRDEELVLVPLEIKFYALENPVALLPDLNSAGVDAAVAQSVAARRMLDDIVTFWGSTRGEAGTRELMNNAMTALVDAAIRLTEFDSEHAPALVARLKKLVDGEMAVRAGNPAVAYLVATGDSVKSRHTTHPREGAEVFVCDPRQMVKDLAQTGTTKAIDEWVLTLQRAFGDGGDSESDFRLNPARNESAGRQDPHIDDVGSANDESGASTSSQYSIRDVVEVEPSSTIRGTSQPPQDSAQPPHVNEHDDEMHSQPRSTRSEDTSGTSSDRIGAESVHDHVGTPPSSSDESDRDLLIGIEDRGSKEGVKVRIGTFIDDQTPAYIWPGNTELTSLNIGVLGDMGTGKTQMCLGLVNSLRRASRREQIQSMSGLILDYKQDYQKKEFLEAVGGIVLEPHNLPIDLFGVKGEKTLKNMNSRAMAFVEIISMVFGGVGNVQRDRLRQVIIRLISSKEVSPTLRDVQEMYLLESQNKADSVTEILNNLVYNEVFSSDPSEFRTLDEILSKNVAVVNLRALDPDQKTKKTLVAVFLNQYFEYMIGLKKWPFVQGEVQIRQLNSFVLVDEAVNIMEYDFSPLRQILLQGREYGVVAILSSQYLDHFSISGTDYAQPMRTWLVHRVPSVSKKALNELGVSSATSMDASAISDLGLHEGYFATFDCPGRFVLGDPFYAQWDRLSENERRWE